MMNKHRDGTSQTADPNLTVDARNDPDMGYT